MKDIWIKSGKFTVILLWSFSMGLSGQPKSIKESKFDAYVSFIHQLDRSKDAVTYILDLFERFDYVVICERHHAEHTQWDLFYNIVNHPGFRSQIGTVYTEIGSYNYNSKLASIINNKDLDELR
jgi:hypothetical protein